MCNVERGEGKEKGLEGKRKVEGRGSRVEERETGGIAERGDWRVENKHEGDGMENIIVTRDPLSFQRSFTATIAKRESTQLIRTSSLANLRVIFWLPGTLTVTTGVLRRISVLAISSASLYLHSNYQQLILEIHSFSCCHDRG